VTYKELSQKHPTFIYKNYKARESAGGVEFSFEYNVEPDIVFRPKIIIPKSKGLKISKEALDNIAFHIGLAEIPSYWKAACSPKIVIEAGGLYVLGIMNAFTHTFMFLRDIEDKE